ncbi:MAG TPA: YidC/Oxa1 family membrane protein insertase, partial [Roseiflexaceae bacterium]|nr:YidC/Oxa1 family membrane protein insertase [Roseiflexaceae bacterium]
MELWSAFVRLLEQVLLTLFGWTGSAGLSIIIFTIIARLLILPLTIKGLQSSRKMQALQPMMKELQRKYGKEPQKLQEETMKLYREYKINPAGGCLPMLLQLPIFFGVYQAVINLTRVTVAEQTAETLINGLTSA